MENKLNKKQNDRKVNRQIMEKVVGLEDTKKREIKNKYILIRNKNTNNVGPKSNLKLHVIPQRDRTKPNPKPKTTIGKVFFKIK